MIKERVADDPEVQQLLTSLEEQLTQERQARQQAERERDQERQAHQQTQAELVQARTWKESSQKHQVLETIYKIVANTNMTYSDRIIWITVLKNHLEEVLALKPFHVNVSRIRQESGASKDTATKFFAAMQEARGIHYHTKPNHEKQKWSSASTVTAVAGHEQVNTVAAAKRVKQRNQVAERRKKACTIDIKPCEACGSTDLDDALSAIVPYCNQCSHATYSQQIMVPTKDVRIIKEIIVHPSHEFSAMTDEDEDLADLQQPEESFSPSYEFQDDPAATDKTDNESNHEISETATASEIQAESPSSSHEFQDTFVTPDNSNLEICECGDKACIEWPVDSDGLYISNAEMENLITERVKLVALSTPDNNAPSSHEFSAMIGKTHQEETTLSSHEFQETSSHPEEIPHTEAHDPSHEFSEGTLVQTPVGIGTISRTAYIRNRWRCAVRFAAIQANGTYYTAFDPTEIRLITQPSML